MDQQLSYADSRTAVSSMTINTHSYISHTQNNNPLAIIEFSWKNTQKQLIGYTEQELVHPTLSLKKKRLQQIFLCTPSDSN